MLSKIIVIALISLLGVMSVYVHDSAIEYAILEEEKAILQDLDSIAVWNERLAPLDARYIISTTGTRDLQGREMDLHNREREHYSYDLIPMAEQRIDAARGRIEHLHTRKIL